MPKKTATIKIIPIGWDEKSTIGALHYKGKRLFFAMENIGANAMLQLVKNSEAYKNANFTHYKVYF